MSTRHSTTYRESPLQPLVPALRNRFRVQESKAGYTTSTGEFISGKCGEGTLSDRDWRVIRRLAEGMKNHEIAEALGSTENMIKNYIRAIFDKMGFSNRVELALWYVNRQHKE